ncbi:hypothetical protein MLD38_029541 [Melastoma candidum]|uniref:Uncharacterized protein n=1 Tax=Melastoma candidum TaxID=119954 RepID=A0ACB9N415_9MYRT|nr:hypothetical protein MLD38_029541 [Melastoma candidum]
MESSSLKTADEVVGEIMSLHRSLPTRPSIEEVEAAKALIRGVEKEDQVRFDAIARQTKGIDVPEELFKIFLEMQKNLVFYFGEEQKREAVKLLNLESIYASFDKHIQRASECVSSGSRYLKASRSNESSVAAVSEAAKATSDATSLSRSLDKPPANSTSIYNSDNLPAVSADLFTRDDSYVKKAKSSFYADGVSSSPRSPLMPQIQDSTSKTGKAVGQDSEKLSLIKLASLIEISAKKGTKELNLQSKLMDQVEWLPDSIGKLSSLLSLDLSENRLLVLPSVIGSLSSLTRLDLHGNRISELPESVGDILTLVYLDLSGNQMTKLLHAFGRLVRLQELNLSSNKLSYLPECVGSLVSLKKLNIETNDLEELPHTIGQCTSLRELLADYNRLKALPEAVGKISTLEVLSVRYNNIKQLPTTMSSLVNLRELDVSFNELEAVPESLCFATTLVKMNVGNNFADLRALPRSIGNLELLEELDISNNQIRVLPDSFRLLTRLRVLRAEQNPLEVPPRQVAEKGAQAAVEYMALYVEDRDKPEPLKPTKGWSKMCCFSRANKRKRGSGDYLKA